MLKISSYKNFQKNEVPPRFELGSLDSKSRVLAITPWNPKVSVFSIILDQNMSAAFVQGDKTKI